MNKLEATLAKIAADSRVAAMVLARMVGYELGKTVPRESAWLARWRECRAEIAAADAKLRLEAEPDWFAIGALSSLLEVMGAYEAELLK